MDKSQEQTPNSTPEQKNSLEFPDWSPYTSEEFIGQISKITYQYNEQTHSLTYVLPQERTDLRSKLKSVTNLSDHNKKLLLMLLNFLEKGQMIDKFGKDEGARHNFLLNNKITIKTPTGEKEITLYQLSKTVNKLAANPITIILTLAQLFNDFKKDAQDLMNKVNKIKENPGYFIPEDLQPIDSLAERLFNYIIDNNPSK